MSRYELVSEEVDAVQLRAVTTIHDAGSGVTGQPGDYLIVGPGSQEQRIMGSEEFTRKYRPIEQAAGA